MSEFNPARIDTMAVDGDRLETAGKCGLQRGNTKNNWSRAGHGDPHVQRELCDENADQRVARGCILHLGVTGGEG